MRKVVWSALANDAALNDLGITDETLFAESSLETPTDRPFAVTRWSVSTPGFGKAHTRDLTLWVHDEPGSYNRIDSVLLRAKEVLAEVVATNEEGGGWVSQIQWLGDSDDLSDDAQGTVTRNSVFRVVGSDA